MTWDTYTRNGIMKRDNTESKKNAFRELKDLGYTNDEIRRALGCSERTLYRWATEDEDEAYEKEVEQKKGDSEQKLQNEVNELREHVERLGQSYTNLWNHAHLNQDNVETGQERAYRIFFETMLINDRKNQAILSRQLARSHEFEVERELKEGRLSAPDTYQDIHFNERIELMARWNKELNIRSGGKSADMLDIEVPHSNPNEVQLECETVECREFEMRIADMCLKRSAKRILDG